MAISQQFNTWSKNHLMTCSKSSKWFRKIQKLWSHRTWCPVRSRLHVAKSRDEFQNLFFIVEKSDDFNRQIPKVLKLFLFQKWSKIGWTEIAYFDDFFFDFRNSDFSDILKYWHRRNLLAFCIGETKKSRIFQNLLTFLAVTIINAGCFGLFNHRPIWPWPFLGLTRPSPMSHWRPNPFFRRYDI